jgi:hypothetical protein
MESTQAGSVAERWCTLADEAVVARTTAALEANSITVFRAAGAAEAKQLVLEMIPQGAQVHSASSRSLEITGIAAEIEGSGRYEALRPLLWSMDRETDYDEIRRLNTAPDVMLGSLHAVTANGSLVAASATGSQLGPYAVGAGKLILVVGTHKIVSDLDEALRRIDEYALPLEDKRAFESYGTHSAVNKLLIINREWIPGRITVIFVDEPLGF